MIKNFKYFLALLFTAALLAACSQSMTEEEQIKYSYEKGLTGLMGGDLQDGLKYMDLEAIEGSPFEDKFKEMFKELNAEAKKSGLSVKSIEYTEITIAEDGLTAKVIAVINTSDGKSESTDDAMIKKNGVWKISFDIN